MFKNAFKRALESRVQQCEPKIDRRASEWQKEDNQTDA